MTNNRWNFNKQVKCVICQKIYVRKAYESSLRCKDCFKKKSIKRRKKVNPKLICPECYGKKFKEAIICKKCRVRSNRKIKIVQLEHEIARLREMVK